MGENIGACMRVMANFGFHKLGLIAPRDGWPNEKALTNSSGANELVDVKIYNNLLLTGSLKDLIYHVSKILI